jgi:iron complex transport system ATP-binding protein
MAVFELVRRIADDGHAVLIVSHQINLVSRFADTMLLLHNGALVASGSPDIVMRGELLESVYEWPLVISRDPATGARALIPLRVRH